MTGQVIAPSMGFTRTEDDFATQIAQTIATDPLARWTFITDNLNTHQAEAGVKLVADLSDIQADLGVKENVVFSNRSPLARRFWPIRLIVFASSLRPSIRLGSTRSNYGSVFSSGVFSNAPAFCLRRNYASGCSISSPFSTRPPNPSRGLTPVVRFRLNRLPISG
ncbi:MAG: hypothetical protein ACYDBJ_16245, partial [Aggregatilineales bacterium]